MRRQMTIWRRVTCSISKTTCVQAHALALHTQTRACGHARTDVCVSPPPPSHTHAHKCVIIYNFCFCLTIEVSCSRLSVTLHVHCLSCWPLKTWLWSPFVLLRLFWPLEIFSCRRMTSQLPRRRLQTLRDIQEQACTGFKEVSLICASSSGRNAVALV